MMKNAVVFVLLFVGASFAQQLDWYGYGGITVPTEKHDEYEIRRARLGVKIPMENLSLRFGYDLNANRMQYAKAFLDYRNTLGLLRFSFGRQGCPSSEAYPSPKVYRLPVYPATLDGFSIKENGIAIIAQSHGIDAQVMHYGDQKFASCVSYHGFSFAWQQDVGLSLLYSQQASRFVNPFVGIAQRDNQDRKDVMWFIQNHVVVSPKVRLFGEYDGGDIEDYILVGANYQHQAFSYVKLFYHTKKEELLVRVTYGF